MLHTRVAGRHASSPGDLATCTARVAVQNVQMQRVRVGAIQVDAKHWIALHYLRPLRLSFVISHPSFLLPSTSTNAIATPLHVRLALYRSSLSKAIALASNHSTVCCSWRSRNSQTFVLQRPCRH